MSYTSRFAFPLCMAVCIFTAAAQESFQPQFTARELFYSAASQPAPAPAAKAPVKAAAKPPARKTAAPPPRSAAAPTPAQAPPAQTTAANQAPPRTTAQTVAAAGGSVSAPIIPVVAAVPSTAPAPSSGTPLGLKYTVLKLSGGDMVAVPSTTIFHANDKIQFSVQTNCPGYLYIISRGSSGTWKPMFPSPEVEDGNNHVDGWHTYTMPPGSRMAFDEQTGLEQFFIVFSREPETDLENMIYSLQGNRPAAQPSETVKPKSMLQVASVNIDDATVGRLHDAYSRDLIIEKVDEKTSDSTDRQENAVYVVNPSGSSSSRVVAELKLVHQ